PFKCSMATIYCKVLKEEAEPLAEAPYPGELGQRILANISQAGWKKWLERLVLIINENQLSTADPASVELIEQHMLSFLFGEGNLGEIPQGFAPRKK
ncbi:MAG TPA: oxidative damage protection protein, partial [Arenicellales bacterium]|nr:oxidative damage protection protein [Arenicellales bacterium]